jgi:flagellum-specific peptidoglycan hydrolase FlgJ
MTATPHNDSFSFNLFLSIAVCVGLWYLLEGVHYVDQHVDIVFVNPDTSVPVASSTEPVQAAAAGVVPSAPQPVAQASAADKGQPEQETEMSQGERSLDQARRDYIAQYARIAQAEQRKYDIPASITLAQGLLESNAGQGKLCKNTNNHFGIKCFSKQCKKGHCKNFTDDSHKDFFVCYRSAWESFRAHSVFLKATPRYRKCFNAQGDYRRFAQALEDAGYATLKDGNGNKIYADALIRLIRLYKLDQYDE